MKFKCNYKELLHFCIIQRQWIGSNTIAYKSCNIIREAHLTQTVAFVHELSSSSSLRSCLQSCDTSLRINVWTKDKMPMIKRTTQVRFPRRRLYSTVKAKRVVIKAGANAIARESDI